MKTLEEYWLPYEMQFLTLSHIHDAGILDDQEYEYAKARLQKAARVEFVDLFGEPGRREAIPASVRNAFGVAS